MGFTEEKRSRIKKYILEKIDDMQDDFVLRTSEAFSISKNTVYRYIREMEQEDIIRKKNGEYILAEKYEVITLKRKRQEMLEEDVIYNKYLSRYVEKLPQNIKKIWQYAFMEMMNNAIEHSESDTVHLLIAQNYLNTSVAISDNGIGIFRKIREHFKYNSLDDAVNELFKGKLTTDSKNHSGEGIFFTSRIMDYFAAMSDDKIFTHNKFQENIFGIDDLEALNNWRGSKGTIIVMVLSNYSNKILREVFDMFSDEKGNFSKTHIPVKNIFDTFPVSRSQAKRLCQRFDKFKEVELDFEGVDEIGQGFAHEIFNVYQNEHTQVRLIPVNVSEDVQKMINHVKG